MRWAARLRAPRAQADASRLAGAAHYALGCAGLCTEVRSTNGENADAAAGSGPYTVALTSDTPT